MHTIRLRGPWQLEPVERFVPRGDGGYSSETHGLPATCRCQMPADWGAALGSDFLGKVSYTRTFNSPTNLDPHERVWLIVEPARSIGSVHLNGKFLGEVRAGSPAGRFDIRQFLKDHNTLQIVVEHPEPDQTGDRPDSKHFEVPGGLVGEVCLEIEA